MEDYVKKQYQKKPFKEKPLTNGENSNDQNCPVNDDEDESYLLRIDNEVKYFESLGEWIGGEPWLASTAKGLYERHENSRQVIRKDSKSYENLLYYYYNLACYYFNELYVEHKMDINSVNEYLNKCKNMLDKVELSNETKKIQKLCKKFSSEIEIINTELCNHQRESNNLREKIRISFAFGPVNEHINNTNIKLAEMQSNEKRQFQNIYLLRIISMIEEAITVVENSSPSDILRKYGLLKDFYNKAGVASSSEIYDEQLKERTQTSMKLDTFMSDDRKEIIEKIAENYTRSKKSLSDFLLTVIQRFDKNLSINDKEFVKRLYIDKSINLWLKAMKAEFENIIEDKHRDVILEVFKSSGNIKSLKEIPDNFKEDYYKILLWNDGELLTEEVEQNILSQFKKESYEAICTVSGTAKNELKFMKTVVNFMGTRDFHSNQAKSILEDFSCNPLISYNSFIERIMNLKINQDDDETVKDMHEAAKSLQKEKNMFFSDEMREKIAAYVKPTDILILSSTTTNELFLLVREINLLIGEDLLNRVQSELSSEGRNIREVHFVGTIIHVDSNLKQDIWKGMNVAVFAKVIRVHKDVTWDVSGNDRNHTYDKSADTGENGHGERGADGYPGESGGNVSITAEKMENASKLTIISNGGNGSDGQNGGDGKKGEDGEGIEKDEFDEKFPSKCQFLRFFRFRNKEFDRTTHNIKQESCTVDKETSNTKTFYIKTKTNKGNEIIFSRYKGDIYLREQGYFVYWGSPGQPGGRGGECGLGGQGGYPGAIRASDPKGKLHFKVKTVAKQGNDGGTGKGGLYGDHGKNGWDMGYVDFQYWSEINFYGEDKKSKLTLTYHTEDNEPSDSVWCGYKEKYARIVPSKIEHTEEKTYEERRCTRTSNELQRHALATRKNNISQDQIVKDYSYVLSYAECDSVSNLKSEIESIEQCAKREMEKNKKQKKKHTTQIQVTRTKEYESDEKSDRNKKKDSNLINLGVYDADCEELTRSELGEKFHLLGIEECESIKEREKSKVRREHNEEDPQVEKWSTALEELKASTAEGSGARLRAAEATLANLFAQHDKRRIGPRKLRGIPNEGSRGPPSNEASDEQQNWLRSYRIATLQDIAKQLSANPELEKPLNKFNPKEATRYLAQTKNHDDSVTDKDLETLKRYLLEDDDGRRGDISVYCKHNFKDQNNNAMRSAMRAFILEMGNTNEQILKQQHSAYIDSLRRWQNGLNIFFEVFISESCRSEYKEILKSWAERDPRELLKSPENELNEKFMSDLEDRFKRQRFELDFDWDECSKDKHFEEAFHSHIKEKGPLSEAYMELLAYKHEVNIKLYAEDPTDGSLKLKDDHNPFSEKTFHVLKKANEFIQLYVDCDRLELDEGRAKRNRLYAKIRTQIETFDTKEAIDDYFNKRIFDVEEDTLREEQYFENEKKYANAVASYFSEDKSDRLTRMLEKIPTQILYDLHERFSHGGKHLSFNELCYLINSILICVKDGKNREVETLRWAVVTHPQREWTGELLLLRLENHFKKQLEDKPKLRKYLAEVSNKDVLLLIGEKLDNGSFVSVDCIREILRLLSEIPGKSVSLEGLELSEWSYRLKEEYWSLKLSQLTSENLRETTYYLLSVENIYGTDLAKRLLKHLKNKEKKIVSDRLLEILSSFHNEQWNLNEKTLKSLEVERIAAWVEEMRKNFNEDKERTIKQLVELVHINSNTSEKIKGELSNMENLIASGITLKGRVANDKIKSFVSFKEEDIKYWANVCRNVKTEVAEAIAAIDRAIELKRGFKLRDTQKLAILCLLINGERKTLAQVSTGEGKSLIVVAASIVKALRGQRVDVVTSSSVLAMRDAEQNRDIYDLFDVKVSHNCNEDIEKRKEAYSNSRVVYGDLSSFQRDYLLDRFYGENVLGYSKFQNVIIDEVDSMLLDRGNNMLYLSHEIPCMDKLESVYVYIWQRINAPIGCREDLSFAMDNARIKDAVMEDLYKSLKKEDVRGIASELNEHQVNLIWRSLVDSGLIDEEGKLLKETFDDNSISTVLPSQFLGYKVRLGYMLKKISERERRILVPNFLKSFVERHLESWIESAKAAFFMEAGRDYVVDVDRTGTSSDRDPNIIILDRDTGTDQTGSQWDRGLHQFLQLKHGCRLSLQSLKAVFISNVSYFKLYVNMYGLTGTLGSQRERDLLKYIHDVDFVTVPTANSKRFHEETPIICESRAKWIECVTEEANAFVGKKGRSVLVVCDTIKDAETLQEGFDSKKIAHPVHVYKRDHEELEIAKNELGPGQIIIATNLAGRGTDIKITKELAEAGGLHICLTYLPNNLRIEQQALGRAARCGQRGSGRLIILDCADCVYNDRGTTSKILNLKMKRDEEELYRISNIKVRYEIRIATEERCFEEFKRQYERLKRALNKNNMPAPLREILLRSCLDKWALWLDETSRLIDDSIDDRGRNEIFDGRLRKLALHFETLETGYRAETRGFDYDRWLPWVEDNPIQAVKLGKYLCDNGEPNVAVEIFNGAIKRDRHFCEAAHYYKAYGLMKENFLGRITEKRLEVIRKSLREAARLFREHGALATVVETIIAEIKDKNETQNIIQIEAFSERQKSIAKFYEILSKSIDDILGHIVTPGSLVDENVNEEFAEIVNDDLLHSDIITEPRLILDSISQRTFKFDRFKFGLSLEELKSFLRSREKSEINEEFRASLKKSISLPSRENFWKMLVKEKILDREIKFVSLDIDKLEELDPSLFHFLNVKIDEEVLQEEFLNKSDEGCIFLHAERIDRQNKSEIFAKDDFLNIVGKDKYKMLRKKGLISSNRKAVLRVKNKIEDAVFDCYDSICAKDFTDRTDITEDEANAILQDLNAQKIIEKDALRNAQVIYRLKIKYDEIPGIQLKFSSVYDDVVIDLLSECFAYRIAFQNFNKQIEEKNFPIRLDSLMTKPHKCLYFELLEQMTVEPTKIKKGDLMRELAELYNSTVTRGRVESMLTRAGFVKKESAKTLFDSLIEKGWIERVGPAADTYRINDRAERKEPLDFTEPSRESSSYNIDETIGKFLDSRLRISKDNIIIESIAGAMQKFASSLEFEEVPDYRLEHLSQYYGQNPFSSIYEMNIFSLNGLDHVIHVKEKKWIIELLQNITYAFCVGITLIVLTVFAAFKSLVVGLGSSITYELSKYFMQGINNIHCGFDAFRSGHFSWGDYAKHLENYTFRKLNNFIIERVARKNVRSSARMQTIQTEAYKTTINRIVENKLCKLSNEWSCEDMKEIGKNYIRESYKQLSMETFHYISKAVEEHGITASLTEAIETLKERKRIEELIKKVNDRIFDEANLSKMMSSIIEKIRDSLIKGLEETFENKRSSLNNTKTSLGIIFSNEKDKISTIIHNCLNEKNDKIESYRRECENLKCEDSETRQTTPEERSNMIEEWKSALCKMIEKIILNPVEESIRDKFLCLSIKYTKKISKKCSRSYQIEGSLERDRQMKRNYNSKSSQTNPDDEEEQLCKFEDRIKASLLEAYEQISQCLINRETKFDKVQSEASSDRPKTADEIKKFTIKKDDVTECLNSYINDFVDKITNKNNSEKDQNKFKSIREQEIFTKVYQFTKEKFKNIFSNSNTVNSIEENMKELQKPGLSNEKKTDLTKKINSTIENMRRSYIRIMLERLNELEPDDVHSAAIKIAITIISLTYADHLCAFIQKDNAKKSPIVPQIS